MVRQAVVLILHTLNGYFDKILICPGLVRGEELTLLFKYAFIPLDNQALAKRMKASRYRLVASCH